MTDTREGIQEENIAAGKLAAREACWLPERRISRAWKASATCFRRGFGPWLDPGFGRQRWVGIQQEDTAAGKLLAQEVWWLPEKRISLGLININYLVAVGLDLWLDPGFSRHRRRGYKKRTLKLESAAQEAH